MGRVPCLLTGQDWRAPITVEPLANRWDTLCANISSVHETPSEPLYSPGDLWLSAAVAHRDCLGARSTQADFPICAHSMEGPGRLPTWPAHDHSDKRWLHLDCGRRLASV